MRRITALLLLWFSAAAAQEARRHYIVELSGEPAAEAVIGEEETQRLRVLERQRAVVEREQMVLRRMLERRRVGVVHSLDTLVNALVVRGCTT